MPHLPLAKHLACALVSAGAFFLNVQAYAAQKAEAGVSCPAEAVAGSQNWSPDSRRVIFTAPDGQIKILSVRFGTVNPMTTVPFVGRPAWSPDGKRIAILQSEGAEDSDLAYATLYMWETIGVNPPAALAGGLSARMTPVWSPDARQLLAQTVDGDLITVDALTGAKTIIYERKSESSATVRGTPAWVSDTEIVYQRGTGTLFIAHVDSGATRKWIGSGTYTAFHPLANGDIWASNVDGKKGELTLLHDGKVIRTIAAPIPAFSGPNQSGKIVAQFLPANGLRLIDVGTGVPAVLTQNPGDSAPAWSPDGHAISFNRRDAETGAMHLCVAAVP